MTPADKTFLADLWHKHNQFMRNRIIHYKVRQADAEDVLNDCFTGLIRARGTLREMSPSEIQKYIAIAVRNQCFKWHYENNKTFLLRLNDEDLSPPDPSTIFEEDEIIARMDARAQTALLLNQLSERDKVLLLGRYIIGKTDEELSRELHCKKSSIRAMMTRAKRNAQDILNHRKEDDPNGQE